MDAGWRSEGGWEGGRSDLAREVSIAERVFWERGVVVLGVGSLRSLAALVDRVPGWEDSFFVGWSGSGSSIRCKASSSIFAFLNSRSINDELSPVNNSLLASSIASGVMFAIRRLFSSSILCASAFLPIPISFSVELCPTSSLPALAP